MLAELAQNTLDGLMLGSAYALLALGFTLIFGVLRRANFAYGPAIMIGAFGAGFVARPRGPLDERLLNRIRAALAC